MGVTAWWQLLHLQHLNDTLPPALAQAVREKTRKYGEWVQAVALPNGAVPTYFHANHSVFDCGARPSEGGCVSATSAISGAVVAKLARSQPSLRPLALRIGEFVAQAGACALVRPARDGCVRAR